MIKKICFCFIFLFFFNNVFFCDENIVIKYNNFKLENKQGFSSILHISNYSDKALIDFFNQNFHDFSNDDESYDENESNSREKNINYFKLYNTLLYTGVGFGALGLVIFSSGMIYSIFVNTKNPDFSNPNEVAAFAVMYSLIGTGLLLGLLCLPFFIASYVIFKRYNREQNNDISYNLNINYYKIHLLTNINISLNIKL